MYRFGNDIVILKNDLDIKEIEKYFNVKVDGKKLYQSIMNLNYYFQYKKDNQSYVMCFNNRNLNFKKIEM